MNSLTASLVSLRFWTILVHCIVNIAIFYTKIEILQTGIEKSSETQENRQYEEANTKLMTAWALSTICFFLEFAGLFSGITIFSSCLNLTYISLHSCGAVFTLWQILEAWTTDAYLYIFGFFSLLPAVVEISNIMFHLLFKFQVFKYIELHV
mmetsp:Transcript_41197/g.64406  ORF Transcript_41197/g.64406 Transcript_41197/m.64406 type:complete len:152 (+) Transcript_41197:59-514(+)